MGVDKPRLLIVDDDTLIQNALGEFFSDEFDVVGALSVNDVKSVLMQLPEPPDVALVDLGLPPTPHRPTEGFAVIGMLRAAAPDCAIVVVSGQDAKRHGQRARALGAGNYAEKPCDPQILRNMLKQAQQLQTTNKKGLGLIGESSSIQTLRQQIQLIAPVSFPVLIVGESGVGKELVARALHGNERGERPFLAVNCAAIPEHLVESTLFGYAKGAFTGAATASAGYLGDAADGTLFLDEIGDLPAHVQPKLLRVLETGEYRRVGETLPRQNAARIIAASNRPPQRLLNGVMRDDLYYRLSVFTISVPPLRRMEDDRFLLLRHFRQVLADDWATAAFQLSDAAQTLWADYGFPGNVRELKNITARLQLKYPGQTVEEDALREELCDEETTGTTPSDADAAADDLPETVRTLAVRLGVAHAQAVLAACQGDAAKAALQLQTDEMQLRRLLNKGDN